MNGAADRTGLSARAAVAPAAAVRQPSSASAIDSARVLQVQAAVLSHARFSVAATAFASEMAVRFGAVRVCVGMVEHGSISIVAMSGEIEFLRNSEFVRAVVAAMDESLEQGASISYPGAADARPRVTLAHAEVARRGAGSAVTVPLVDAGQFVGALTIEHRAEQALDAGAIRALEHFACMLAPVLELKRDAQRPWHARLRRALRELRVNATAPGHALLRSAAAVAVAILAALLFWPVDYRVSAPAQVEGAIQRILVAPADGFLREAHVKPGDAVVADQVLVELADQDLRLERRKWASELAQHENSYRSALAKGERTQFVVSSSKAGAARAQLELVEQQLGRSSVRAPFDGIVIKGDLSQSLGAPVQRGDVLLTVSPAHEFRLIVNVDERDIRAVTKGADGVLALAALPDARFAFHVVRVTPVATVKDGHNFYEVEGRLDSRHAGLRPGLQGIAKIDAGEQTWAWIWLHRFVDWVRLAFWSLGG